ncbi:type II toxin-antitoxin system RelE/ParE family toxin [Sphingobacterium chungjuense]|uniref:type II toxin-antitoxin system RelE/ParE family toxin n=1 Tax=Sphingobacterium chungjuense TaxID=2675553 RepID=UPI00140830E3|nr:type II toxin-antitoxin system RelE/ParE family toxin [Sphingobacterium chungjuense]
MKITYSNKIKKKFGSPANLQRAFGSMAKKVQQRIDDIEASPNLKVLQQIPAANCHPLSGNRKYEWAVDISGNHRLIFELEHDPIPKIENGEIDSINVTDIRIIETTDYH